MADFTHYQPGGIRNAPRPDIAGPTADPDAGPVASFSTRQADPHGTGHILSNAGRTSKKPHGDSSLGGGLESLASPLDLSNVDDLIARSGLGPKDDKSPAEQASDSDGPTQEVQAQDDGSMVHTRMDPSTGGVQDRPIGAYGPMSGREAGSVGVGRSNYSAAGGPVSMFPDGEL